MPRRKKKPKINPTTSPTSPTSPPPEPFTDDTTICANCTKPSKTTKFRPLVNENGDFLCDECYVTLFPATAMCDQDQGTNANLKRHIVNSRRRDNRRRRTEEENEHEECRQCLDPGHLRRCCRQYYCHVCYYNSSKCCPGCHAEIYATGVVGYQWRSVDPGRYATGATWLVSAGVVIVVLASGSVWVWNEVSRPETVWGHECFGWFPTCGISVCVDGEEESGSGGVAIGGFIPTRYRFCDFRETRRKLFGKACVFDAELYQLSDGVMGYDFCYEGVREREGNLFDAGEYVFEDNFDYWKNATNFRLGESVMMANAFWKDMTNAAATDICGVNIAKAAQMKLQTPDRRRHQSPKSNESSLAHDDDKIDVRNFNESALVFTGVHFRYAETSPLAVPHGGRVEFYLKMAPVVPNGEDSTLCKTAYGGDVSLSYTIADDANDNATWTSFGSYPVWKYRHEHFTKVVERLPPTAWSRNTRFRWQQTSFEGRRDYWALDDVKVFASFEEGWRDSQEYKDLREVRRHVVHEAQCCLDTEHCRQFPNVYMVGQEGEGLCADYEDMRGGFKFKSAQVYIIFAAVIHGIKLFYIELVHRIAKPLEENVQQVHVSQNTFHDDDDDDYDTNREECFPKKVFTPITSLSWRLTAVVILVMPLLLSAIWLSSALFGTKTYQKIMTMYNLAPESYFKLRQQQRQQINATIIFNPTLLSLYLICIVALVIDAMAVYQLLKNVFNIRHPPQITIDTHPDRHYISITHSSDSNNHSSAATLLTSIPLNDVKDLQRFSHTFIHLLTTCYFLGGLPYATVCLVLRSFWLPYDTARVVVRAVGWLGVARALAGPDVFVKVMLSLEWLLSATSEEKRDDMGRAIKRSIVGRFVQYLVPPAVCITALAVGVRLTRGDGISFGVGAALVVMSAALTSLAAVIIGMMQELPVSPQVLLTTWPGRFYDVKSVRYTKRVRCPCLFRFAYCGDMHTRDRLLICLLDDGQSFMELLTGDGEIDKEKKEEGGGGVPEV